MNWVFDRSGDEAVAHLHGTLTFHDHEIGEKLVFEVERAVAAGPTKKFRLDLGDVPALDSHWLGVFVRILRKLRERGIEMVIARPTGEVRRVLEIIQIDRIVPIQA